jgi:alpha-glucosidase
MPWASDAPALGFTEGTPWLPVGPDHAALAVDRQEASPQSMLALTRRLIALRNAHDALLVGGITIRTADDDRLAFERHHDGETLLCLFNFSPEVRDLEPAQPDRWRVIEHVGSVDGWRLDGFAAVIARRIG